MLLDAAGNPLRSAPTMAPDPTLTADEAADVKAAQEIGAVRQALRTAAGVAHMTARQNAHQPVHVPASNLFALLALAVAALDDFIEKRLIDENGVRETLPDSHAKAFEQRVGDLIATVTETIAASQAAQTRVQVAPRFALGSLPQDAEKALRGEM